MTDKPIGKPALPSLFTQDAQTVLDFCTTVLAGINTGVWVTDRDDKVVYFNRAMENISGLAAGDALGKNLLRDFAEPAMREFRPLFLEARQNLTETEFDSIEVAIPEGGVSYHSGRFVPLVSGPEYRGMICIVEDVTERQRAARALSIQNHHLEKAVRERTQDLSQEIADRRKLTEDLLDQQATLDSILRSVPAGIGMTVDRRFSWVGDFLMTMLGYGREELLGQSARIMYPSDEEFERVGTEKYVFLNRAGMGEMDTQWKTKDGRVLDVHLRSAAIDPYDLRKGVIFTGLDITDRKQSEASFRAQYQGFPHPIYTWRALDSSGNDFKLIDANKAAFNITRQKIVEYLGVTARELWKDELALLERLQHCFREQNTVQSEGPYRFRSIGERRYLRVTMTFVPQDLVLVYTEDITDRRAAEEQRRKLEVQMRHIQKLESLGVLAGGIAHDFNNLLMGVLGNAGLALMDLPPEAPIRGNLEQIEATAKRLADLTSQLLAYSGRGKFLTRAIDLSSLVRGDVELLRTAISKKAALRLNLSEGLPTAEADPSQLRQVLMNLVTNASEALEESEGVITLTTGQMEVDAVYLRETFLGEDIPEGMYAFIEVSDTGKGMDADIKSKMFDPFFTTKFAGRGLGLAAVLGIVRGHHGTVKVYSETGQGTTVKVLLPASGLAASHNQAPGITTGAESGKTVLVVDDEDLVLSVAKQALKRSGMNVLTASDGQAGVEVFRRNAKDIDLVLLDMTMPRLNGEEVYREIRRIRPEVPVILSSGYNQADATNRFAGKGLAGFLQKPYLPSKLIAKVREVLG